MEISCTDRVKNEVLHGVKEERNIVGKMKRLNTNRIYHILCRKCSLKHVIEGKVEGRIGSTGRRGRKSKLLLGDLKKKYRIVEIERRSTRSHCEENWFWKRLWTGHKTDHGFKDYPTNFSPL
jgi:hypothetical protein